MVKRFACRCLEADGMDICGIGVFCRHGDDDFCIGTESFHRLQSNGVLLGFGSVCTRRTGNRERCLYLVRINSLCGNVRYLIVCHRSQLECQFFLIQSCCSLNKGGSKISAYIRNNISPGSLRRRSNSKCVALRKFRGQLCLLDCLHLYREAFVTGCHIVRRFQRECIAGCLVCALPLVLLI